MPIDLDTKRQEIEATALATPGVVGVSIGLSKQGQPIIKILVDRPLNTLSLPSLLIAPDIELQYIGDINAQ